MKAIKVKKCMKVIVQNFNYSHCAEDLIKKVFK